MHMQQQTRRRKETRRRTTTTCNIECKSIVTPSTQELSESILCVMQMRCVYWVASMALVVQNSAISTNLKNISFSHCNQDESYAKAHYFYAYLPRSRPVRYDEAEEH
eukprot:644568_1